MNTVISLTTFILLIKIGSAYNTQYSKLSPNVRFYQRKLHKYQPIIDNKLFSSTNTESRFTNIHGHDVSVKSRCEKYAEFLDTNKRWGGRLGDIIRYLNTAIVGTLFSIMLKVFNKFTVYRAEILFNVLWEKRNKNYQHDNNHSNNNEQQQQQQQQMERGILTVANHKSFYDDPGIFSALLPWWRITPDQMRWTLCTEDVFFSHPFITSILGAGNVIPLDRFGSLDQPILRSFLNKLNDGKWCHIFVEGKVRQNWRFLSHEPKLGKIKVGVGKLIAHSHVCPVVIPIYHSGMDKVLPEIQLSNRKSIHPSKPISYLPTTGNSIKMYFGTPLDFTDKIAIFKHQYPQALTQWRTSLETLQLYIDITSDIKQSMLALEAEANCNRDNNNNNHINNHHNHEKEVLVYQ